MLTASQLEYLIAVDRHGSFSKAAEKCFVTQPTLSMQIQKMEAELGVSLFDRRRKPVQATPLGQLVIERAYRALQEFKAIAEVVREQQETLAGELRLGIIPTLGPYLLPRFIPDMLARYAGVRVTVREMLVADIVADLRRDMLDVGIAATPLGEKGILESPLFYEPFYGFVSAGHRLADRTSLSAGDFVPDEMILLDSGHCLHGQVSQVCLGTLETRDEKAVRLRFVGGSLEGLIRIVESGHGVTLLPELAATTLPESSRGLVRPLQSPVPARQVSMITHGEGIKTRMLEVLRQSIFSGIPQGLKKKKKDWRIIDAKQA
ncbi:hydrogen peroxide-inducible genes activator [uncultured Desulfosarcina sp.]|uniref:hydrogen peroxide-inducible genes activator n=1 Tax=uncultured Desulfosarcina sp. TaxID=218289 RepID=UPI0029C6F75A|nr:hydrogen peroxide-inducible genes activator [uncultured Desulfosarcina sp.]